MNEDELKKLEELKNAITTAVTETVSLLGTAAIRQLSMFPSADFWKNKK